MKEGVLVYDERQDRIDIRFGLEEADNDVGKGHGGGADRLDVVEKFQALMLEIVSRL